jgi:hypothetical protein
MGDFLNNVVIFLEEYYVYVIGVGLIIILMLIGLLTSKKKAKKSTTDGSTMANINDVNTGSINDVANTIQGNTTQPVAEPATVGNDVIQPNVQSNNMQPIDVVTFPESTIPVASEQSLAPETTTEVIETLDPSTDDVSTTTDTVITPAPEEVKPVAEDRFDKTEVIDFSSLGSSEHVTDIKASSANPFVVDNSLYDDSILNGESSSTTNEPKA